MLQWVEAKLQNFEPRYEYRRRCCEIYSRSSKDKTNDQSVSDLGNGPGAAKKRQQTRARQAPIAKQLRAEISRGQKVAESEW